MKKGIGLAILGLMTLYYFLTFTSVNRKYEILNEVIRDNGFKMDKVCNHFDEVTFFDNNLVDFTIWDKLSAQTQKVTNKFHEVRENAILYFPDSVSRSPVASRLESDCEMENESVYKISLPIVSADGQTVLIKITQDCNCGLGGQGGEYLFKMIDGKWRMTNRFNSWIS
jgi:hypothetical protein